MSVDEQDESMEELHGGTEGLRFIMAASLVSTYGRAFHIEIDEYDAFRVISQRFVSTEEFDRHCPASFSW